MKPTVKTIRSQPSWVLRSDRVELCLTQLGGHMAPVTFFRNSTDAVQPYYISPWQGEKVAPGEPVLVPLRGNFFCMPFGGDNAWRGEDHVAHGEPATGKWQLADYQARGTVRSMTLTMDTAVRPGRVTKRHALVEGQNVVYTRHVLEGYSGRMPLGHHATLSLEARHLRVSHSPFVLGMTCPELFSDPANREYQSLAINERFDDLARVPLMWKHQPVGDCTVFPQRLGFTDLLGLFSEPHAEPAWTAAVCAEQRYVWFSLKDPSVLPATVFWISNRGRHGAPWNGRNICLGLEDVCAYFASGLRESVQANLVRDAGIPTAVELRKDRPKAINYIEGVARAPGGFRSVERVEFGDDEIVLVSDSGERVSASVRWRWLEEGDL